MIFCLPLKVGGVVILPSCNVALFSSKRPWRGRPKLRQRLRHAEVGGIKSKPGRKNERRRQAAVAIKRSCTICVWHFIYKTFQNWKVLSVWSIYMCHLKGTKTVKKSWFCTPLLIISSDLFTSPNVHPIFLFKERKMLYLPLWMSPVSYFLS